MNRRTVNPEQCAGDQMPELEMHDLKAVLQYAAPNPRSPMPLADFANQVLSED
jgi:hypothetical protein